jgi:NAD(P)-dependent dehydrogenase (short-subunit alcohol dehydrogenase family)
MEYEVLNVWASLRSCESINAMPDRIKDVSLAGRFTSIRHSIPTPAINPAANKLSQPLNVCIIGASRGIGAGIAYAFAQAGAQNLILTARPSSSLELAKVEQKAKDINPTVQVTSQNVDLTSSQSVADLTRQIKKSIGKLDVVILNSGWSGPVVLRVEDGDPQDFQDVFDVNVQGTYLIAHHFIPLLRESNGRKTFIAVGSFAACINSGIIANTAYCVSKFAQTRLIEFLSEQYGEEGILAVTVHPGAVNTEMADSNTPDAFRPCKSLFLGLLSTS